jgi:hypothetical protein
VPPVERLAVTARSVSLASITARLYLASGLGRIRTRRDDRRAVSRLEVLAEVTWVLEGGDRQDITLQQSEVDVLAEHPDAAIPRACSDRPTVETFAD